MLAGKPVFVRLALVGVSMFLAAAVIVLTAVAIDSDALFFALATAIPALIIGAAIYFWRPWGLVLGVLGGLFGLLFFTPDAPTSLASPNSFYDFILTIVTIVGAVFLLVGSIGGLVQHFQHKESFTVTPLQRSAMLGVVAIIVVLGVISAVLTAADFGGVSAAEEEGATIVTARKTLFDVESISARPNSTTKIVVKNKDPFQHTFTVDDLDIDVKVGPGAEKLINLSAPAGAYEYRCRITGHEDMKGTVTVQ